MVKTRNSDALLIQRNMMTLTGVWPNKNPKLFYKIRRNVTWTITVTLYVTMWMEAINDLTDLTKLSEILYIMVSITSHMCKLGGFTRQTKKFLKMIKNLDDQIFYTYPDDLDFFMANTVRTSAFIANAYRYLCGVCILMYALFPVLDNTPLPLPFPYDLGIFKYVMYVFQVVGLGCTAWNNSCLDTLATSLMGIAAAQFDILGQKIVRIKESCNKIGKTEEDEEEDERVISELRNCCEHHLAIINYVETIEEIFTFGLFAQFLGSVVVICNTLFHILIISSTSLQFFMLANYFIVMISQLYMYCWYGNQIIYKSSSIAEYSYLMNWYDCGSVVKRYIFIIMERSHRPLSITALKFSKLSLGAFASIIQWSYSYFALLQKLYNKKQHD